ncbi:MULTISPECIES: SulP family inorganic anion transporter [Mycobacterium]|uniref:Sodium-independent anion transporter n=1 Tax=Mycobacterium syngnathidarum TaxID=1908205 RepID=A0A1S1JSK9_9MYCO|nr:MULTISPECIES: SulP family inorganic anion transporter [Mycobacterium]MCG7607982.1 SulP family inorganic anion transporter [Mycobacterium sp. CnD-18-1]OHT90623.1 sodium-independent anion transporter [Mycobacterium syngnathidarum]
MSITLPGFRAPSTGAAGPSLRSPAVLRTEVLAGLVVALALIPEAIAFSVIAGVDPRVGLFSTVTMAITIAFTGGRPAMITAATAAVALVVAPVSREFGVGYLVATILLAGVLQMLLAAFGVAKLMRFIPRSVMVGFVNALAILVLVSQLRHLVDVPWLVYVLSAAGVAIMVALPKLTTAVPAPLVVVFVLTVAVMIFGWNVPDVGDQGALPDSLPVPGFPQVPLTLHSLQVIAPYALGAALVGLLESLMTAKIVDDITDTASNKTREACGQGMANVVTAVFGGMGGCAVIGQTMMNVKVAGARTRLSTLLTGVFVLILVVSLGDLVGRIPMAALVAVMIVVSFATFDWHSVTPRTLKMLPRSETLIMVVTVIATVVTGNLAIGVSLGVLAAMVAFARRVAHFTSVTALTGPDGVRTYRVRGDLFFVSSNDLVHQFDYADDPAEVVIDMSGVSVWDASSVASLDAIRLKYSSRGKTASFTGLDGASLDRLNRLSGRLGV